MRLARARNDVLVDVVALRHRGVRLPPDEVRSIVPVRSILSLDLKGAEWRADHRNPRLLATLVAQGEPVPTIDPLDFARLTKIKRTGQAHRRSAALRATGAQIR